MFYVNTHDVGSRSNWERESLFIHEAVPGHHFQIALAQEQEELPAFRRFGGQTAYVEGWALYAETLGEELGVYTDPYQRLGALTNDIWRANRLVVDTGLHAFGWTRERAIAWMESNCPITHTNAVAEVERYMVMPGQALAYKIGQLNIRDLRRRAEDRLGDRFDIKAFHRQVLADGSMPLTLLEQKIDDWISAPGLLKSIDMSVSDWDAYWRNARSAAAHKDGGPQDEVLERFWLQLFEKVFPSFKAAPRMLDIACGNGAVTRFALASRNSLGPNSELHISGIDESPAALEEMRNRDPVLCGIAADAALLPFQDGAFDLVTSQFGMEYARPDSFAEAARVVTRGGLIAAVLHLREGGIYRECAVNLEAINGFRNCNLLHDFEGLFRAAMAVQQGHNGKDLFRRADEKLAGSVTAAEAVLQRWGKSVADGTLYRVYTDVAHIYSRFKNYEPGEVFTWIDRMGKELDTYSGRMATMLQAALDERGLEQVTAQLTAREFSIRVHDILNFGQYSVPSAWVIVAERSKN